MKETSKIQDTFFSLVRKSMEEFQKIKLEDINILQKVINVHDSSLKTGRECFKLGNYQSETSCQDEPHTKISFIDLVRKVNIHFLTKDNSLKVAERTKQTPKCRNETHKSVNKPDREMSSRQFKGKKMRRTVSRAGKRTLPSSPTHKTKRFELNRLSSKRRKLPQPPKDNLHQETWTKGKANDQEKTRVETKDDQQKTACSSTKHRRPLRNVLAQDGFVRPAAWASIRPQITKQPDDIPFFIPTKLSPIGNRQKMVQGSESTVLKNENREYKRGRVLSFIDFFRKEYDTHYDLDLNTTQRSQRKASAMDELETYLINKKVQRVYRDILRE